MNANEVFKELKKERTKLEYQTKLDLNSEGCLTENFMFWKVKNV